MSDDALRDLQSAVQMLSDREEIRELIAKYSYYFDMNFMTEFFDLFVDDCVLWYGPDRVVQGRAEFEAGVREGRTRPVIAASHQNANVQLTVDGGDSAQGIVSLYSWQLLPDGTPGEVYGYYHDEYRRTPAGWRFAARRLEVCGAQGYQAAADLNRADRREGTGLVEPRSGAPRSV